MSSYFNLYLSFGQHCYFCLLVAKFGPNLFGCCFSLNLTRIVELWFLRGNVSSVISDLSTHFAKSSKNFKTFRWLKEENTWKIFRYIFVWNLWLKLYELFYNIRLKRWRKILQKQKFPDLNVSFWQFKFETLALTRPRKRERPLT